MRPDRISFATAAAVTVVVTILFYYYLTAPIFLYLPAGTPLKVLTWSTLALTFAAGVAGAFASRRPVALSLGVGCGLFLAELAVNHGIQVRQAGSIRLRHGRPHAAGSAATP